MMSGARQRTGTSDPWSRFWVVVFPKLAYYIMGDGIMQKLLGISMTSLNEIYNSKILELAAHIPRTTRLADPDATATAHSKLCGSTISIDIKVENGKVIDYGQTVKACLLGQSAASIVGREVVGARFDEIRAVVQAMRAMLKADGAPPVGRWADLAVLQPVKDYKARHASTLLVFDALERALDDVEGKASGGRTDAAAGAG